MTTEVLGSTASTSQPWIPDDSTFGARLALIRQRMGWGNVKEAATACGLPTESWRTWERDGVEPRGLTRIARKIADATGCSYAWLLDGPGLRSELAARGQNLCSGQKSKRPRDNRPTGRPHSRPLRPVSPERPSTRRPQRPSSPGGPIPTRAA